MSESYPVDHSNADPSRPLRLAVLGATGSIGRQALDVCRAHPDRVRVTAVSALRSVRPLVQAAVEFGVAAVAVADARHADDPDLGDLPPQTSCDFGDEAVAALAERDDVDVVLNAVVGAAGIACAHAALRSGKRLLSANKESLVVAGDLLMPLVSPGQLVPVDSEHSAIFQCLGGEHASEVQRVWLTCSGGPFYGWNRERLQGVTCGDALAHPTWSMGDKITIDSATLMNKGLEVLEAAQLFSLDIDSIEVLVHRQSRIHSMVEFVDGSVKAQLGPSDMRVPIQYALSYPSRWESVCEPVSFFDDGPLTFGRADDRTFECLALAREAGRVGGTMPCAMNAANEVANQAFRDGACGFLDIGRIVGSVMDATPVDRVEDLQQIYDVDERARRLAASLVREVG